MPDWVTAPKTIRDLMLLTAARFEEAEERLAQVEAKPPPAPAPAASPPVWIVKTSAGYVNLACVHHFQLTDVGLVFLIGDGSGQAIVVEDREEAGRLMAYLGLLTKFDATKVSVVMPAPRLVP